MHSRIFELRNKQITEEDRYLFSYEDMEYLPSGIDYLMDLSEECEGESLEKLRQENIQWLFDFLRRISDKVTLKNDALRFKEGFREEYFSLRYTELKELVKNLSLTAFVSDDVPESMDLYRIENAIEDRYSFYVLREGYGYQTLDRFVRTVEYDKDYHIGGIGDYHF